MKRITALLLLLCIVFMSSCRGADTKEARATALSISGAEITEDVFAYFLSAILHDRDGYSLTKDSGKDDVIDKAVKLCEEYVAVNSLFEAEKLQLTPSYKYQITSEVSTKWDFYKNYYDSIGISKQTVTKFETYEAKKESLLLHFFGEGGSMEIEDSRLKEYFEENYVTFKSINGYLTTVRDDGSVARLGADEITSIENKFKVMCDDLRTGATIEDICTKNAGSSHVASTQVDTVTINRFRNTYPSEFFNAVKSMPEGSAKVIETADNIFLVVRQKDADGSIYGNYKTDCLKEVGANMFEALLLNTAEAYDTEKDTSLINGIYSYVSEKF